MMDLHNIGNEIETILSRLRDISSRRETYGITSIVDQREGTSSSTTNYGMLLRRSYPHVKDDDAIGTEKDTSTLVAELMKEEERLCVVSIVGMGGLGQTTRAKKVFNHSDVKRHFDCYAWAFISQQCKTRDVLLEILKGISTPNGEELEMIEKMKYDELVVKLHNTLKEKRYLVVLDDIWRVEDWNILKPAFPNGKIGSKVLLTTRNMEVATDADPRSLHLEPRCLTEDEGWELLCRKAFLKNESGLEKCGREMVNKSGSLPLAIVVLGGILATKKSLYEWEAVLRKLSQGHEARVKEILAISYNELPYHLKPCFLYLGLFPEDSRISTERLIHMWVDEGFVRPSQVMEDVGEQYLEELSHRCMVQIEEGGQTFYLHDLMRDLCISKAREEKFYEIIEGNISSSNSSSCVASTNNKLRRCAIYLRQERNVSLGPSNVCLRSVLFFPGKEDDNTPIISYQDFKLVRVLDLEGVKLRSAEKRFCKEIGKLVHLRYLGLGNTQLRELPKSVGNLRSLQTLDLRSFPQMKIPDVIWKLEQLRHLYIDFDTPSAHLRLGTLRKLQTLSWVEAGRWIERDLVNLTSLRVLEIRRLSRAYTEVVLNSTVVRSDNLRVLGLGLEYEETFPNLEPLSRNHRLLQLYLKGYIENPPSHWPPNLTILELYRSKLKQDSMAILQNLQNLEELLLWRDAYVGKELVFSTKAFPQLRALLIYGLKELEEWRVEEGALPCLKQLRIWGCKELKMIPDGLRFVTTLRELDIIGMPMEFEERVKEGGEDWYKVRDIPSITTN